MMTSFLLAIFWSCTHRRKTNDIIGIPRKLWGRNTCAFCVEIFIWKFDLTFWPDLDLISIKRQIGWRCRVKWLSPSISACKMIQKTCVAQHVCDFYFIVTSCDLTFTLTFSSIPFILMRILHGHLPSTLGECELFAARLTDPGPQNVKTLHSDLWPDLDLTHDLNLRMPSMD